MLIHVLTRSALNDSYDLVVIEGTFGPQVQLGEDCVDSLVYLEVGLARHLWR